MSRTSRITDLGRGLFIWLALALCGLAQAADPQNGQLLAGLGGCASCHTVEGQQAYAGGYAIETDWGTYYGPNLTPDDEHGLGTWSLADFTAAMREGRSPRGHSYYPAFPYPSFTGMTDEDLRDLWAFFKTVAPAATANREHEPSAIAKGRWKLGFWRMGGFKEGPLLTDDRGEYLVDAVGHCGECHTPRGGMGRTRDGRYLQGNPDGPEPAPSLIGLDWSERDWRRFLKRGALPDGDVVGGVMGDIVKQGTSQLSDADREELADYLMVIGAQW